MNGLFPIIRRKRRPLVVEDVPPLPVKPAPVQPVSIEPVEVCGSPQGLEPAASPPVGAPKRKK